MTDQTDGLSNFIDMTVSRFFQDYSFRLRLLAEADETSLEKTKREHRDRLVSMGLAARRRRTA